MKFPPEQQVIAQEDVTIYCCTPVKCIAVSVPWSIGHMDKYEPARFPLGVFTSATRIYIIANLWVVIFGSLPPYKIYVDANSNFTNIYTARLGCWQYEHCDPVHDCVWTREPSWTSLGLQPSPSSHVFRKPVCSLYVLYSVWEVHLCNKVMWI